jgi:hypothetical protein
MAAAAGGMHLSHDVADGLLFCFVVALLARPSWQSWGSLMIQL